MTPDTTQYSDSSGPPVNDPLGKLGLVVGKYQVESHLKTGGFGEIYVGFNVDLPEKRVVIKFLKRDYPFDRFENEARLLCRFNHPNICTIIDFLPSERALIIPLINGKDCEQILRLSGPFPEALFRSVGRMILDAIAYAHEHDVAHRDIKPANILLDERGRAFVIDFGIAKETGGEQTKTGYYALTPQFAAPERVTGQKGYDPFMSDVYELGVTLYNLITGDMPYRNPGMPDLRDWSLAPRRRISTELTRLLRKAAHPDPKERYASVADLAAEFKALRTIEPKPRKTIWKIGVAVVAVAAIAFGAVSYSDEIATLFAGSPDAEIQTAPKQSSTKASPDPEQIVGSDSVPIDTATSEIAITEYDGIVDVDGFAASDDPVVADDTATVNTEVTTDESVDEAVAGETATGFVNLTVEVEPSDRMRFYVDGDFQAWDAPIRIATGIHTIAFIHPDYPIFGRTVDIGVRDTTIRYSLSSEFSAAPTLRLHVALYPFVQGHSLEVSVNGERRIIENPSVLELRAGAWRLAVNVRPDADGNPFAGTIDSCVTFPFGGSGPRIHSPNGSRRWDFTGERWQEAPVIPLVFFWSQR